MRPTMQFRNSQRGVTLIEMMIALVVGLLVSAAALALVASIVKSNADTVRATRLSRNCVRPSRSSHATCGERGRFPIPL